MKNLIITFGALLAIGANADTWKLNSKYEAVPNTETQRSILEFSNGKKQFTYRPTEVPFGMVSTNSKIVNKTTYIVTGWSLGANSLQFKVFAPDKAQEKPLCEVTSLSEEAKLRENKGQLEIQVLTAKDETPDIISAQWIACKQ